LDNQHKKFIFEFIQTEFEECTENLSQIIARPYLKTPKNKIIKTTKLLKRKRIEFLETIAKGLILPDTPPSSKKFNQKRWKYLLKDDSQDDEDLKNAIALSIKELSAKDPWIVDKKGRHTNLIALLNDMPELENNLETIFIASKNQGICKKHDCRNPKAINTLTGLLLNYCSIKCMKSDRDSTYQGRLSIESNAQNDLSSLIFDDKKFNSELEQAIELSKRQKLRQLGSSAETDTDDDSCVAIVANNDDMMQLAIELSLKSFNDENNNDVVGEEKAVRIKGQFRLPFYLANKNDLNTLFKNMNDIVSEEENGGCGEDRDKCCNKQMVKSSLLNGQNLAVSMLNDDGSIKNSDDLLLY
jgi:hypothetical protein